MVLVNVVVAVLLDKFVTEQEEEPEEIDADALLDGASDVGTEASRQATAKPPKSSAVAVPVSGSSRGGIRNWTGGADPGCGRGGSSVLVAKWLSPRIVRRFRLLRRM